MDLAELRQVFLRDGCVVARGLFAGAELARLTELAEEVQAYVRRTLPAGTRFWYGDRKVCLERHPVARGLCTWGVNEITRPELFRPELVDVLGHPRLRPAVEALLGPEPRAWGLKILWSPKVVPYDLGWHRDQMRPDFYDFIQFKPAEPDHVQFNVALRDDRCFLAVPGSHRRALTEAEWAAVRGQKPVSLPGEVEVALAPGDVVFMDAHVLHRGRSGVEADRLTLHYSAQAQWVPLAPWGEDENFAWLQSEEFLRRLAPATRPFYERLRTAERHPDALAFARAPARAHGWPG